MNTNYIIQKHLMKKDYSLTGEMMKREEWLDEIARECEFAKPVCGGAYCYEDGTRNYCDFYRCPKVKSEFKL